MFRRSNPPHLVRVQLQELFAEFPTDTAALAQRNLPVHFSTKLLLALDL